MKTLLGGQKVYIGKTMAQIHESHQKMGITDAVFDETLKALAECLTQMRPEPEVFGEILKKVESLRPIFV